MAKIILKSPYYKPNSKNDLGKYIKYIATREGVEKVINPNWNAPASPKQTKMINEMLELYPSAKESFEFKEYDSNHSSGNAHELIGYIIENNMIDRGKYINYIAERPRVEKLSTHGLFTSGDEPISLSKVSKEISESNSNVWTHIISLKREDAERLGYNDAESWKALLDKHATYIAQQMRIKPSNFRWYAAFHNESHHPHVHMVAYSINPEEAYLTKKGIENIKMTLAKDIFEYDMMNTYIQKDQHKERLKSSSKEVINDIVSKINAEIFDNTDIQELLIELASRLSTTKGKLQYGYLPKVTKNIIDSIVDLLEKDENISELYELWYQKKIENIKIYTDNVPEKQPLSKVNDFRAIKNMVVQLALDINADAIITNEYDSGTKLKIPVVSRIVNLYNDYYEGDANAAYLLGRIYSTEQGYIDYKKATQFLLFAGENGNSFGYYQLGKLYYYGNNELEKDTTLAEEYLKLSSDQGNQYANQMLYSIQHHRNTYVATSSLRLLHYMSNLIRKRMDDSQKPTGTDRKEREKTNEKKQAQGLRISM